MKKILFLWGALLLILKRDNVALDSVAPRILTDLGGSVVKKISKAIRVTLMNNSNASVAIKDVSVVDSQGVLTIEPSDRSITGVSSVKLTVVDFLTAIGMPTGTFSVGSSAIAVILDGDLFIDINAEGHLFLTVFDAVGGNVAHIVLQVTQAVA